jgi:hypothetical protein
VVAHHIGQHWAPFLVAKTFPQAFSSLMYWKRKHGAVFVIEISRKHVVVYAHEVEIVYLFIRRNFHQMHGGRTPLLFAFQQSNIVGVCFSREMSVIWLCTDSVLGTLQCSSASDQVDGGSVS